MKFVFFINASLILVYLICVSCSFMNRLILLKELTEYLIFKQIVISLMFLPNKVKWVAISCGHR